MNIATIQKRKFLYNIYKNFYSLGVKPSDHEIKKIYNQYFSFNELGEPVKVDLNKIQASNLLDHHVLNEMMINTVLNLEVLYDCVMENNNEIFSIITVLNNKLDNLRAKRKEIESKIDQLLFANSNSDGFFYSYVENFASTTNIDLDKSSAFVDLVNNNSTIPKIVSENSNQITNQSLISSAVTGTVTFNSSVVYGPTELTGFESVFDGLNDTYWLHEHFADAPGVTSMTISIPVSAGFSISKIEGSIISQSPCSIFLKAIPSSTANPEVIRTKDSKDDYNRFSFILPNDFYSSIAITLYKNEPDKVLNSPTSPYVYSFGLRELTIGALYYDERAQLISNPISVPTSDNSLLTIESVAIDAKTQVVPGTELNFYIAVDVENATNINDFNWIPIEPSNFSADSAPNTINLVPSNFISEYIDNESETGDYDYEIIPVLNSSSNTSSTNNDNPIQLPFSDKTVYRLASVNNSIDYKLPVLLSSVDNFRSFWMPGDSSKFVSNLAGSLSSWASIIGDSANIDLRKNIFTNYSSTFNSVFPGPSSELIEARVLCSEQKIVSHTVTKSGGDFDLFIYLNGSLIGELLIGQTVGKIEWNFSKGINVISIAYDNESESRINFDLMVGANLSDYGTVLLDYFSYLDPIEFRRKVDSSLNVFTIDNIYGSRQILCSKEISKKSILRYYSDSQQLISAIRYRVDFNRYSNPLQTPVLDAIRVKFKHNDI